MISVFCYTAIVRLSERRFPSTQWIGFDYQRKLMSSLLKADVIAAYSTEKS